MTKCLVRVDFQQMLRLKFNIGTYMVSLQLCESSFDMHLGYQRQKQSLSYASPLVVYWDPLKDHSSNDKVCHESL